jgi:rhodanese-related sulfurtransferase
MRTLLLSVALAFVSMGCKEASPANEAEIQIAEVSVEQADEALKAGAVAVDANSESTRKKHGTVPSAILLTSSSKYDLAELPQDKSKGLIFYCSNTRCTASDAAAERASNSGYSNVRIMRQGIKGWRDAGKATAPYPQS